MANRLFNLSRILSTAAVLGLAGTTLSLAAEPTVAELVGRTHIHGLAFDRADPTRLFVATHHGVLVASPDGSTTPISEAKDDFMGFTPHPRDPAILFASGHPSTGGNLGFIRSDDAGRTWTNISPGAGGPVDFHQLAAGAGDPAVLYGVYKGLQVSSDAGVTWTEVGPAPAGLIDLAVSMTDPKRLYAATEAGLLESRDGGKNWTALIADRPVTSVEATADGTLLAFVYGSGLYRASEAAPDFTEVGRYEQSFLLHVTVDATDPTRMAAVNKAGRILVSADGGATWTALGPDS